MAIGDIASVGRTNNGKSNKTYITYFKITSPRGYMFIITQNKIESITDLQNELINNFVDEDTNNYYIPVFGSYNILNSSACYVPRYFSLYKETGNVTLSFYKVSSSSTDTASVGQGNFVVIKSFEI